MSNQAQEIYLSAPEVEDVAKKFETFNEVLQSVIAVLKAVSHLLQASAFVSMGATEALNAVLEQIIPRLEAAQRKCEEITTDVRGAIAAYTEGDTSISTRFAGG